MTTAPSDAEIVALAERLLQSANYARQFSVSVEKDIREAAATIKFVANENRVKSNFLYSRQCADHSGKWMRGTCLQCENERLATRAKNAEADAERLTKMNAELSDRLAEYRLSPERYLQMTGYQIEHLWDFVGKERDADITIGYGPEFIDEGEAVPAGLRAWFTEYPEEGSLHLYPTPEEYLAAAQGASK